MADLSLIKDVPDGAYVAGSTGDNSVKSLSSMTEESAKAAMRSPIDSAFGGASDQLFNDVIATIGKILNGGFDLAVGAFEFIADGVRWIIGGIADALTGFFRTEEFRQVGDALHDTQENFADRRDLIPPYCSAVMGYDVQMKWVGATITMPFNTSNGPFKDAHVDADKSGIVFDIAGTWTVHALLNANGGDSLIGGDELWMYLRLRNKEGELQSEKIIRAHPGREELGFTMSQPFVVPEPGWYVQVAGRSGMARWWPGGARYSGLSVVYSHADTDGAAPDLATSSITIEAP